MSVLSAVLGQIHIWFQPVAPHHSMVWTVAESKSTKPHFYDHTCGQHKMSSRVAISGGTHFETQGIK